MLEKAGWHSAGQQAGVDFQRHCLGHVRKSCMISLTSESQRTLICYNLTCGFRAQAENEHYRISVVATNTEGMLEYWIICGDSGCASSDEGHNMVPLRHWWCVDGNREAHILAQSLEPYYTSLLRLFRSFLALLPKEGEKKKNGLLSRTAFYTRLISMLGCLNCLLEAWREIEQYPLASETSPVASHLFLCRAGTEFGTTPLRKPSRGRPGQVGQDKSINISSIKALGSFGTILYCDSATWAPTIIMWINC